MKQKEKQRLTAFIDPVVIKRIKVRGALEGLTISQIVEKALDEYAPKIEKISALLPKKSLNLTIKPTKDLQA